MTFLINQHITKAILLLSISLFSCSSSPEECYYCAYDVIDQTLCLNNGVYSFEEQAPFDEVLKLSGKYNRDLDTLILNEGISRADAHKFENEVVLVRKDNKLHYLYKGGLSPLSFEKK